MRNLKDANASVFLPAAAGYAKVIDAAKEFGVKVQRRGNPPAMTEKFDAFVFDAQALATPQTSTSFTIFQPHYAQAQHQWPRDCTGSPTMQAANGEQTAARRAIEGFTRSVAKEVVKKKFNRSGHFG